MYDGGKASISACTMIQIQADWVHTPCRHSESAIGTYDINEGVFQRKAKRVMQKRGAESIGFTFTAAEHERGRNMKNMPGSAGIYIMV